MQTPYCIVSRTCYNPRHSTTKLTVWLRNSLHIHPYEMFLTFLSELLSWKQHKARRIMLTSCCSTSDTVSQKRVHMFFSISLIGLYLIEYWTYKYDITFTGKVCITAFWPYMVYYIMWSIEWDNQKLAQPTHVDPFFAIKFYPLIFE